MPLNMSRKMIPVARLTLTAAQLAALYTTPIKILDASALAADEFMQFLDCLLIYNPGATPFTIGSAGNFSVKYSSDSGPAASGTLASAGLIDQTSKTGAMLTPVSGKVVCQGDLYLCLSTANPSGGDGTLEVKLMYRDPRMSILEDDF